MLTFEQSLREAGTEILEKIGISAYAKMNRGGQAIPGILTERTGRLIYSIMGVTGESIRETVISGDTARFTIGTKTPYAALHEKGGVRIVTEKMRRFFWAKWFGDKTNPMWSALRFKNIITFPARPFLRPAVDEVANEIPQILERYTMNFIKLTIEESITGTPRAVPLNAIK